MTKNKDIESLSQVSIYNQFIPENGCIIGEIACGHNGDPEKLNISLNEKLFKNGQ